MRMHGAMVMALAAAAITSPFAAFADPPAASVPTIPAPFIGAPTNDNPTSGQFSVNFDDQGRFLGLGTTPEPYGTFVLAPENSRTQARFERRTSASEAAAANAIFASFRERLRDVAGLGTTMTRNHR